MWRIVWVLLLWSAAGDAGEDTPRAVIDGRQEEVERLATNVRDQAAGEWRVLLRRLESPDPEVVDALRSFVARWARATVAVDGFTWPVVVPEVDQARRALHVVEARPGRAVGGALAIALSGLDASAARPWEAEVRALLLDAHDRDASGALDSRRELDRVPCEVWRVLDDAVQSAYGAPLTRVYGFAPGGLYSGDRLGIDEPLRGDTAAALEGCDAGEGAAVGAVAATIRAIPDGGSSPWDAAVQGVLLDHFDADRSGELDQPGELEAVPCEAWAAIDDGVRQGWPEGLRALYGFANADRLWIGYALGVALPRRADADARMAACGLEDDAADALGGVVGLPPGPPPVGAPLPVGDPAAAIRAVPGGGSSAWDGAVQRVLVGTYDRNSSGEIDADEVRLIGCGEWAALDDGVRQQWSSGLLRTYGFLEDGLWLGGLLGLSQGARQEALGRASACLDGPRTPATGWLLAPHDADGSGRIDRPEEAAAPSCAGWSGADAAARAALGRGLLEALEAGGDWVDDRLRITPEAIVVARRAIGACGPLSDVQRSGGGLPATLRALPDGGSSAWDEAARPLLLGAFDADGSGALDGAEELRAVPCDVWAALDEGVRAGWQVGLFHVYGFAPDLIWVGGALGVDEAQRSEGARALARCGLAEGPVDAPMPPAGSGARPGSPGWEEASRAALLASDADGDGRLSRAEVARVPCGLWRGLDAGAQEGWGLPLAALLGLTEGMAWQGEGLGLPDGLRGVVRRALERCGPE